MQEDLPNVERPFAAQAESIGTDETTLIDTIRSLKERKLMRRFAAVMNHRSAGFKANAMGVWAVPDERLEETRLAVGCGRPTAAAALVMLPSSATARSSANLGANERTSVSSGTPWIAPSRKLPWSIRIDSLMN